ncbi:sulfotransferase family protein [Marinoscillum furvescens]|uniref:Sulfotransferase domain-containing protein n=1 Tax=Marinoscillum furvescens DSM 4134 TaxID=1122208 RepID=A0A3D9L1D4_MARFU|nr:sulfotransferase [Marinoscillum furvescens]RED96628.1 sulfotransferase domain-containing protein [Marinoscillum furvescens DSM 4134]
MSLEIDPNRIPKHFLIGVPKSGTTSLSIYLREHPNICFSQPKETNFFATHFPDSYRKINTWEKYFQCFGHAKECETLVEGSVSYLHSPEAIKQILEYRPDAKFLVIIRNLIEVAQAHHSQRLRSGDEDIQDFEKAWRLQEQRREGKNIPKNCSMKEELLYHDLAKVGSQITTLLSMVDRSRVRFLFFEDLKSAPRDLYLDTLSFLNIPDDGRKSFTIHNKNRSYKLKSIQAFLHNLPSPIKKITTAIKQAFNINEFAVITWWNSFNQKQVERPPLREEFRNELIDIFREEVEIIESITERNLSHWKC